MTKYLIIIGLLISLFFLVQETATTWKHDPLADSAPARPPKAEVAPIEEIKANPYPAPPTTLPDLGNSYLFNEKRTLKEEEAEKKEEVADDDKPTVDLNSVTYVGSIITKKMTKAIITYTETPGKTGRTEKRSNPNQKNNYTHLGIGDPFYNYTVAAILPDRIVFAKGEENIERLLFDPSKKRLAAPAAVSRKPTSRTERPPQVTPEVKPAVSSGRASSSSSKSSSSSSSSFRKSQPLVNLEPPSFPQPQTPPENMSAPPPAMMPSGMNEQPQPRGGTPADMNEPPQAPPPDINEPPQEAIPAGMNEQPADNPLNK